MEKLSRFNEIFIKNYNENSNIGYFLEVDIDYPKELFNLHKGLPFLPERKKVNKGENKRKICYECKILKASLKSWISLKKVHRVIQVNQKDWLKPYIDLNSKLRKEAKTFDFEKDFFKLINNSVFRKAMENVRNHKDIKLVTTDEKKK